MELKFKKGDTVSFGSNNETIILTGESMYSPMDDAVFWIGLDPAEYLRKVFNDKSDEIGSDIKI